MRGYACFLQIIGDPRHEEYRAMQRWAGGSFAPASFNATRTTRVMRKGLPDHGLGQGRFESAHVANKESHVRQA